MSNKHLACESNNILVTIQQHVFAQSTLIKGYQLRDKHRDGQITESRDCGFQCELSVGFDLGMSTQSGTVFAETITLGEAHFLDRSCESHRSSRGMRRSIE
jgi:hypothetical protein